MCVYVCLCMCVCTHRHPFAYGRQHWIPCSWSSQKLCYGAEDPEPLEAHVRPLALSYISGSRAYLLAEDTVLGAVSLGAIFISSGS